MLLLLGFAKFLVFVLWLVSANGLFVLLSDQELRRRV